VAGSFERGNDAENFFNSWRNISSSKRILSHGARQLVVNLMFFWPCIINWLYINYQLWCTDYYLIIKYYSPLHVSSLKCSSSGGHCCIHTEYGTVTLYKSSWWPVDKQLEWELTVGGRLLVGVLRHPPTIFPLQSVLTQAVYREATRKSHREWQ